MGKKINFNRAGNLDPNKAEGFFESKRTEEPKNISTPPVKKVRVFVDLSPEELQLLDKMVAKKQSGTPNVVPRSKVAKELLMRSLYAEASEMSKDVAAMPSNLSP